jgi:hypothetical protein
MKMSLVDKLTDGLIDIIGDVHGEYDALVNLMKSLGYDTEGFHKDNRKLIFVGDLCDRGPDSPSVIRLVKKLVDNKNAQVILGNHELNLLQKKAKDGSGWYFEERYESDKSYKPFKVVTEEDKEFIYSFLSHLPMALENDNLRIVHAAWDNEKINQIREMKLGSAAAEYNRLEKSIDEDISKSGLLQAYRDEQDDWSEEQVDAEYKNIPFLENTSKYNLAHQMNNPMRVLTSGVEQKCELPFYASGKWRFVERYSWWDKYEDNKPVVVGHFWRKMVEVKLQLGEENVFKDISPFSWHGKNNNVFCVDFSAGGRFKERNEGKTPGENTFLVALRWPERELMLENGDLIKTTNFNNEKKSVMKFK